MKKLLIADDERTIREGIANSIDWCSLGISEILLAADGRQAARIIETEQPLIAIIDIIMPEMTGLEVIAGVYEGDHAPEFIIISGHDEFEYAQKAISYNVRNYILKPCDLQEITATIKNILEELEARQSLLAEQKHLKEYVDILMPPAQEQIIRDFLLGVSKANGLIKEVFEEGCSYQLLFISVADPGDYPLLPVLRGRAEGQIKALCWSVIASLRDGIAVIFKAGSQFDAEEILKRIDGAGKKDGELNIRAAISGAGPVEQLPELYREASEAIRYLPFKETFDCERAGGPALIDASVPHYSSAVRQTIQYIRENFAAQSLSLQQIAANVLYLNPDYLGKIFKKETGIRFSDYVLMLRMEKAKQLIAMSTEVRIYEIAEQVGLGGNAAYFGQVFKKYTGVLPSDYRDEHLGGHRADSGKN